MGKKKKEHVVFDGMRKQKNAVPITKVNKKPIKNFHQKIG